ncbi:hypothetical protein RRG08_044010 [Elysia crispata]|uniref:Uncharacterized protein n=1 Tax=Elysia crispata TaxID=231223 RepID=A0AAE0Y1I4_9GAST|nr:hypothetical protein RRG08_044010 [Elysia crispata]
MEKKLVDKAPIFTRKLNELDLVSNEHRCLEINNAALKLWRRGARAYRSHWRPAAGSMRTRDRQDRRDRRDRPDRRAAFITGARAEPFMHRAGRDQPSGKHDHTIIFVPC